MAPIKFEELLKDKLEKRSLSPSSETWSKLSERLDTYEQKSKSPIFWWLSIAAGLLIMITISVQFFGAETSEEVLPQVVEENISVEPRKVEHQYSNTKNTIQLVNENSLKDENYESYRAQGSQNLRNKQAQHKSTEQKTQLAENDRDFKNPDSTTLKENLTKKFQKENDELLLKNAVTEALNKLKTEKTSVTDREIDSLLKFASKELFKEKLQRETTLTVDAQVLLMSVQDEMGQSFRSKVFEALMDSYETVKTAVAQRNN